jgi:hypothetical protein
MAKRTKASAIHPSIKTALGYDVSEKDASVLADWKSRTSRVCKPCWELKYCPYGPLVEQSPILPSLLAGAQEQNKYFERCLRDDTVGTATKIDQERRKEIERWLKDPDVLLNQAAFRWGQQKQLRDASSKTGDQEKIETWLGRGELPPIQEYRVSFEPRLGPPSRDDVSAEVWAELNRLVAEIRSEHERTLATGVDDNRQPLEPARRAWFQRRVDEFEPDNHPTNIPDVFEEAACNIFGHICPVFFAAESATETNEARRIGRGKIPFATMMRIVRRDDYRCQHCKKKLRDDEVEFDHIIPVSRGGSSEEHNVRLTCFDCNRDKADEYTP